MNGEEKKNPYHKEYGVFSNIGFVLGKVWKYDKKALVLIIAGAVCSPLTRYLWTFMSKFILDAISFNKGVYKLIGIMVVFALAQLIITMASTLCESDTWWRFIAVRMKVIHTINRKAMTVDYEQLEDADVMDCFQKARNAVDNNNAGIEGMMHQTKNFLDSLTVVAAGIAILSTMSIYIVAVMLLLSVINFAVNNYTNKTTKKKVWDPLAPWWRKNYYISETATDFAAAKDIRMFGLRGWMLSKHRELNKTRFKAQITNANYWSVASIIGTLTWIAGQCITYAWLIFSVLYKNMTIGNFMLYLASAETLFGYIQGTLNQITGFFDKSRQVDDFRSFLDIESKNGSDENKVALPELGKYEFVFDNVSFKYPRSEKYALKDLNLTLRAGERIAVVGLNGAGKSTMIKLLLRLYEPTEGRILLNGVDVKTYDKESYYRIFSPVFQDIELFAFTLSQNVSMQDEKNTDDNKTVEVLNKAGLGDKLASLAAGIKTQILKIIYDDGTDLSGGEKQKLALARALYKDAPVIVLDEPTAALDALAEATLYENFNKLIGGKTAVYISHRLSSTKFCHAIAMFKDGKMEEYGTHEELMAKGGSYAELFTVQAQYYVEGKEEAVCE